MKAKANFLLLCLVFVASSVVFGQRTHSFAAGVGTIYYYGDLTDNFNNSLLRPALSASYSKYILPQISFRVGVGYGEIGATDGQAIDPLRIKRNLHFRSTLAEVSGVIVYEIFRDKNFGNAWQGKPFMTPYIFGGIAFFRFNPKAIKDNVWHELQPLGTEGQYIPGNSPGPYALTQASVPLGAGLSLRLSERSGINFEVGYRTTFTDYLDDVSDVYPDFEALKEASGQLAVDLSERAGQFNAGQKRGNPGANDSYFYAMFSITYYLNRYASRDN